MIGLATGTFGQNSALVIAEKGATKAVVVVSPEAGLPVTTNKDGTVSRGTDKTGSRNEEWAAANDLVKYIEMMTGAKPRLASTREEIAAALKGKDPVILVGEESGTLETILVELAQGLERHVDLTTRRLTSLLEPMLILVMGSLVGFIILAVLLPILQIQKVF